MTNDLPGVIAGRYEVGPLIGRGATARVHRAVDRELGREVAVKVYDSHVVAVEQLRRAREKTLLASVQHPGVVAVYDSGTEGDRPYLVMQLVDGENLAERLCAGPFGAAEVSELGVRLADALTHVHARHIVHRDLKPANVLLGPGGPLITDFGIAHALDATHITGTGLVTGTAAYLAPEQILGEQAGPPADIYALGLILLECLTGQLEFPGTLAESAAARLHRAPRIPAGTPEPLAAVVREMTARDPADRPSAEQVRQWLREPSTTVSTAAIAEPATPSRPGASESGFAAASDHTHPAVPAASREAAPVASRRRPLAAVGALATVAAAAVVVVAVLSTSGDPGPTPSPVPEAAPGTSSVPVPSQVTLSPASAVVLASSEAGKPAEVVAAGPKKDKPEGGRGKGGGPAKRDAGPHGGVGEVAGPGGPPGKR
ncbi:protein kinase domain-containing protein [Amycolatopsis sp. lyj-23]|uniref:serine/threonine-protein kinase n=1 Tax=Amycolatopsis sp. lyj-23 TaxID=2789283 RepID=UPI003979B9B8